MELSPDSDLSIVVPVYKSAGILNKLWDALEKTLIPAGLKFELILVEDASHDGSWAVIEALCSQHKNIKGVALRKNFGQDSAILTGLRFVNAPYTVIMDDDLQHDPKYILEMLQKLKDDDADVIYANFDKKLQSVWKNLGSWFNGKCAELILGKPKSVYLSPYKIIRSDLIEDLCAYQGYAPYIDGLLFQLTDNFGSIIATYHRRESGAGNYNLAKSIRVWGRLIFSFSIKPLRIMTILGVLVGSMSIIFMGVVVLYKLLVPGDFSVFATGWASLMASLLLTAGLQLIFGGIIGEYVGRCSLTVSGKPQTVIKKAINMH